MGYRLYLGNQVYCTGLSFSAAAGQAVANFASVDCWSLHCVPTFGRAAAVRRLHQLRRAGVKAWLVADCVESLGTPAQNERVLARASVAVAVVH